MMLLIVSCAGCATVVVGAAAGLAGTYVWTQGNLECCHYSVDELYDATRQTLDELDYMVQRDRHDHFEADVSARTERGQKVLIRIEGETERLTRIRVRFGVFCIGRQIAGAS